MVFIGIIGISNFYLKIFLGYVKPCSLSFKKKQLKER